MMMVPCSRALDRRDTLPRVLLRQHHQMEQMSAVVVVVMALLSSL